MSDSKMKLIRKNKSDNFTIVDNEYLRREDMSARSKGLLTYILSLPDDWKVYKKEIFKHHKEGYGALNTAFNELKEFGYINHYSIRDKKGRIKSWNCEIYEDPIENYSFQNEISPDDDKPELGKQKVTRPEEANSKLLSTYNTNNLSNKVFNKLKEEDDDINRNLNKVITQKIKYNLKKAGIKNLTKTKLLPLARSMNKLIIVHNKKRSEAEKVLLLAIELYELNNGRTINYLIAILEDWEQKELYDYSSIINYIDEYKNAKEENIEPVPMINWLEKTDK